jgi:hypothetical protein
MAAWTKDVVLFLLDDGSQAIEIHHLLRNRGCRSGL